MKKRYFQLFLFIVIFALLLSACQSADQTPNTSSEVIESFDEQEAQPTSVVEPEVTINFTAFPLWYGITGTEADGKGQDYWEMIAGEFSQAHPNVTINIEMADWATYKEILTARLEADNPPDVTYMCDNDLHLFKNYLLPLDSYIDEEYDADVTADTWGLYTVDSHVLGFPGQIGWNTLIINADLFRERGVTIPADPERAWTWDEFMDALQKLTFDRDGDGKIDVYGTAVAGINWDMEWYNLHYAFNRGARFMDPTLTKFTINDEQGIEAIQWLLDLQEKYKVIPTGAAGLSLDDAYQMLFRGQVAIFHGAPWVISWMESSAASGEIEKPVDLMIVQYPHSEGETMVTDIASCGFAVFNDEANPEKSNTAAEFAKYMTSSEKLRDWKAAGYVPARLSSMEDLYSDNPNMTVYSSMAQYGRIFWARDVDMWTYADQLNSIIPAVFNMELTPKEALDQFVSEAQPIFDDNLVK